MDTLLFTQLFCNNIHVRSKNEGVDIMKTVQLFDFHFIPNCLKGFKVINWKLWKQILWMISICVKMRNLWLIMVTYCIYTITYFWVYSSINYNYFFGNKSSRFFKGQTNSQYHICNALRWYQRLKYNFFSFGSFLIPD